MAESELAKKLTRLIKQADKLIANLKDAVKTAKSIKEPGDDRPDNKG